MAFPDPNLAEPSGLLAIGGDLSVERLLAAYEKGVFPWYDPDQPILWWSPDPRMVLAPSALHIPRSLKKVMRKGTYEVRFDTAFGDVIRACSSRSRPGQTGTWIGPQMIVAYEQLHRAGYAHCAEAWCAGELVGGLYGVRLGRAFFGESMFAVAPDASKVAFVTLVEHLASQGIDLIDCQVNTDHLARFGAQDISRTQFLRWLASSLAKPWQPVRWASVFKPKPVEG